MSQGEAVGLKTKCHPESVLKPLFLSGVTIAISVKAKNI